MAEATVSEKVDVALELAYHKAIDAARKFESENPDYPSWEEVQEAFDAFFETKEAHPDVRPDVWAFVGMCIYTAIQSLDLQGATCDKDKSVTSPTTSNG